MSDKYTTFELHDPALVDLADYGRRNGLNTRAQVEASMALELEAMDKARLEREAAKIETLSVEQNSGGLAVAGSRPTVVFLNGFDRSLPIPD